MLSNRMSFDARMTRPEREMSPRTTTRSPTRNGEPSGRGNASAAVPSCRKNFCASRFTNVTTPSMEAVLPVVISRRSTIGMACLSGEDGPRLPITHHASRQANRAQLVIRVGTYQLRLRRTRAAGSSMLVTQGSFDTQVPDALRGGQQQPRSLGACDLASAVSQRTFAGQRIGAIAS